MDEVMDNMKCARCGTVYPWDGCECPVCGYEPVAQQPKEEGMCGECSKILNAPISVKGLCMDCHGRKIDEKETEIEKLMKEIGRKNARIEELEEAGRCNRPHKTVTD